VSEDLILPPYRCANKRRKRGEEFFNGESLVGKWGWGEGGGIKPAMKQPKGEKKK